MNTGRHTEGKILCKENPSGEYMAPQEEYSFRARQDGSVEYRRADGAGSWMKKYFWEKALKDGNIEILQG